MVGQTSLVGSRGGRKGGYRPPPCHACKGSGRRWEGPGSVVQGSVRDEVGRQVRQGCSKFLLVLVGEWSSTDEGKWLSN